MLRGPSVMPGYLQDIDDTPTGLVDGWLATGDLFRAAVQQGTPTGLEVQVFMDTGELVPDEIVIRVVDEHFAEGGPLEDGFILDGFPRTLVQAEELEKVLAATRADGVTFIGVNVRDQRDPAAAYLADIKPTYGSIFDPRAALALDFDVPPNSIPATLVIDKEGRIAAVMRSEIDQPLLEPVVRELLAERA